jgi:hypothetical protein
MLNRYLLSFVKFNDINPYLYIYIYIYIKQKKKNKTPTHFTRQACDFSLTRQRSS